MYKCLFLCRDNRKIKKSFSFFSEKEISIPLFHQFRPILSVSEWNEREHPGCAKRKKESAKDGAQRGGKKERKKKIADRKELPRGEARLHGYFVFCEWGRTLVMVIVQQRGGREKWHKRETAQKRTRHGFTSSRNGYFLSSLSSRIEFFYLSPSYLRVWKVNSLPVKKDVFQPWSIGIFEFPLSLSFLSLNLITALFFVRLFFAVSPLLHIFCRFHSTWMQKTRD